MKGKRKSRVDRSVLGAVYVYLVELAEIPAEAISMKTLKKNLPLARPDTRNRYARAIAAYLVETGKAEFTAASGKYLGGNSMIIVWDMPKAFGVFYNGVVKYFNTPTKKLGGHMARPNMPVQGLLFDENGKPMNAAVAAHCKFVKKCTDTLAVMNLHTVTAADGTVRLVETEPGDPNDHKPGQFGQVLDGVPGPYSTGSLTLAAAAVGIVQGQSITERYQAIRRLIARIGMELELCEAQAKGDLP